MRTTNKAKAQAFIQYASDTEGMNFILSVAHAHEGKPATYSARPARGTHYAPEVIHAVQRNFRSEYGS